MAEKSQNGICLALGFFDCMHLGHRAIIAAAREYARARALETVVFTFTTSPKIFGDGKSVYTFSERSRIYAECGADRLISVDFDQKTRDTSPAVFLDGLFEKENIKAVFCGEDYRFGAGGAGDTALLKAYCEKKGATLEVLATVKRDGEKVSSTRVRELLENGNIGKANELLGEPYRITSEVVAGRGEGRKFGFPTANVRLYADKIYPADGVYATRVKIDDKLYFGATNVGKKPTFGDESISIETFVDEYSGDLYGKTITLFFVGRLRAIEKFSSPEELAKKIMSDVKKGEQQC